MAAGNDSETKANLADDETDYQGRNGNSSDQSEYDSRYGMAEKVRSCSSPPPLIDAANRTAAHVRTPVLVSAMQQPFSHTSPVPVVAVPVMGGPHHTHSVSAGPYAAVRAPLPVIMSPEQRPLVSTRHVRRQYIPGDTATVQDHAQLATIPPQQQDQVRVVVPAQGLDFAHEILESRHMAESKSGSLIPPAGGRTVYVYSAPLLKKAETQPSTSGVSQPLPVHDTVNCTRVSPNRSEELAFSEPSPRYISSSSQLEPAGRVPLKRPRSLPEAGKDDLLVSEEGQQAKRLYPLVVRRALSAPESDTSPSYLKIGSPAPCELPCHTCDQQHVPQLDIQQLSPNTSQPGTGWKWSQEQVSCLLDLYEEQSRGWRRTGPSRQHRLWPDLAISFACRMGFSPGTGPSAAQLQAKWKKMILAAHRHVLSGKNRCKGNTALSRPGRRPALDTWQQKRVLHLAKKPADTAASPVLPLLTTTVSSGTNQTVSNHQGKSATTPIQEEDGCTNTRVSPETRDCSQDDQASLRQGEADSNGYGYYYRSPTPPQDSHTEMICTSASASEHSGHRAASPGTFSSFSPTQVNEIAAPHRCQSCALSSEQVEDIKHLLVEVKDILNNMATTLQAMASK